VPLKTDAKAGPNWEQMEPLGWSSAGRGPQDRLPELPRRHGFPRTRTAWRGALTAPVL